MKKTKIYSLYTGDFGDSGFLSNHYKYKKDALAHIKKQEGFVKNKEREEPFYENFDRAIWYRIDEDYILGD